MSSLEKALQIMLTAHSGQVDKGDQPYVLHPIRVMLQMHSIEERIVAILHDVIEDSSITLSFLESEGFNKEIVSAVECLTKRKSEAYDEFIERVTTNSLATRVKIEDIRDNLDITRLHFLSDNDLSRVRKYRNALSRLEAFVLSKRTNQELR